MSSKRLTKEIVDSLKSALGDRSVLEKDLEKYTRDWQNQYGGPGSLVVLPSTAEQVSAVMRICDSNGIKVVPQSGNTSLVAGATPIHDEVVLSVEKMRNIIHFDETSGVITCQAGVILEQLQNFLAEKGYATPYDLGARGSCMVGGNISTMACGIHFVQYGSMRNYILGLEVVLPNGTILDMDSSIRKDNTGPDLKQLFIGSEGVLGIITKASMLCPKKPLASSLVFARITGYQNVLHLYREAKAYFGSNLGAIEYLDLESYTIVQEVQTTLKCPFDAKLMPPRTYFMLIEVTGANEETIMGQVEQFCEAVEPNTQDIILPNNKTAERQIWEVRERVAESCTKYGDVLKYDFSLNISLFEAFLDAIRDKLRDKASKVSGYAHIGDGNLHLNIVVDPKYDWHKVQAEIEPFLIDYVISHRGSISAEHGIGYCKTQYLSLQKPKPVYDTMLALKRLFDPNNTLNPGKVFPSN